MTDHVNTWLVADRTKAGGRPSMAGRQSVGKSLDGIIHGAHRSTAGYVSETDRLDVAIVVLAPTETLDTVGEIIQVLAQAHIAGRHLLT